jgi:16S rRNA (cytosine967-C5)-methyltransferase
LRRRPEARWRRTEADLADLVVLQRELAASAVGLLRPGGVVAYATCSPHLAETRGVVDSLLSADQPEVELLDARTYLPEVPRLGAGPTVQLWPHRHGTDAMFLALLRRRGGGRDGRPGRVRSGPAPAIPWRAWPVFSPRASCPPTSPAWPTRSPP